MSAPTLHENWHEHLIRLNAGWDGYDGRPITRAALDTVGGFHVVPCSDGGVQVEVHRDGFEIEICVAADGRIESAYVGCVGKQEA